MTFTVAHWKRTIKPGMQLLLVQHGAPDCWKEPYCSQLKAGTFVRTVKRVQSNGFTLVFEDGPDKGKESWFYWPKAAEFRSSNDAEFAMIDAVTGKPDLTYWVVNPDATPGEMGHVERAQAVTEIGA